ncbi:MAG TPA: hypothetical protein VGC07_10715 [Granulicella sp.]
MLVGTAFDKKEQKNTLDLVEKWWLSYKAWEERDTFIAAFRQGRMTIRQAPASETYGEYMGKDGGTAFGARRGDEERKPYPKERYRVGMDSIKDRLKPSNFGMDGGERLKYKHGLHDLSGSLCAPTVPLLSKQVRWKWGKLSEWITIFMPMAQPEDLELFSLLNSLAKQSQATWPEMYIRVAEMRKQMSRIKLADSVDIGAGLHDVSPPDSDVPKFRYGVKQPLDSNRALTGVDLVRSQKALNYTSILPTGPANSNTNEIVIAYRQHAGVRFPLFTRWNAEENAFLCFEDEPSSKTVIDKKIPDAWERTLQV